MAGDSLLIRAKTFWRRHAPTSYARVGTTWHFWRISENVRARLAAVAYALGYPGVIGAGRTIHVFDARRGEFTDVYAILVDHLYERVPGFEPRAGAIVVDVGANVGTFSLHHAGHGARVYAFEPQPGPFRRFRRAIALSGLSAAIKAAPIALADYTGHGSLDTSNPSTTMARLAETGKAGPIPIKRLDDVLDELGHIDLLKIDTEGAEGAVLAGAHNLLARTARIVLEYHDAEKYTRCRALLQAAGFTIVAQDPPDGPAALGLIFAENRRADLRRSA
jgi:FkbM family methyltransferase